MRELQFRFEIEAPWELALLAYDRKSWSVPSPDYKEVVRCDFSDWAVDPINKVTTFKRRVQIRMPFPSWIMRFITDDKVFWTEFDTKVDRKKRDLLVEGGNTTLLDLVVTREKMHMYADPSNPQRTVLEYDSSFRLNFENWVAPKFEKLIAHFYVKALKRGRTLDKKFIDQYKKQHGSKDIPPTRSEETAMELYNAQNADEPERLASLRLSKFIASHDVDSGLDSASLTAGADTQQATSEDMLSSSIDTLDIACLCQGCDQVKITPV